MLRSHMRSEVHPGGIEPAEEWRVRPDLMLHEVNGGGASLVVDRLHPLPGERASVFDGLPADLAQGRPDPRRSGRTVQRRRTDEKARAPASLEARRAKWRRVH